MRSLRGLVTAWMLHRFVKPRGTEPHPEQTIEELRRAFESIPGWAPPPAGTAVETSMIGALETERLTPPGANPGLALLWFFGGGYCVGSPASTRGLAARIASATGTWALVPCYRLCPEHPLEAGLEDALAAYRWLVKEIGSAEQVVVGGVSAGGGLALRLVCALRDAGDQLPSAIAVVSPSTDLALTGASMSSNAMRDALFTPASFEQLFEYLPEGTNRRDPRFSPLYANLAGLPPVIIHVSSTEMLLDDSVRFADRARGAGVEVTLRVFPGLWHSFPVSANLPEANKAVREIAEFARQRLAGYASSSKAENLPVEP